MVVTMYNEEIKKLYIEGLKTNEGVKKSIISAFNTLEKTELKYKKDLGYIPLEIIAREILENNNVTSFSAFKVKISRVRKYKQWILEKNLVPDEYKATFIEDNTCDTRKIFEEYNVIELVKTPEDLNKIIHESLNLQVGVNYTTNDFLAAGYLFLMFSGIKPNETIKVKISDVEITKKELMVRYDEHFIVLPQVFYREIRHIVENRIFFNPQNKQQYEMDKNRLLDDGHHQDDINMKKRIIMCCSNRKIFPKNFRSEEIYIMGHFYRNPEVEKPLAMAKICYGDNPTRAQKERVKQIFKIWKG